MRSLFAARVFAPRLLPTLLAGVACALLASLGVWQLDRAAEKRALIAAFAAGDVAAVALPSSASPQPRYARVSVAGHYLADRQFLLDNMTHEGAVGYRVLTPLVDAAGVVVLVDRGWLPAGARRDQLPNVAVDVAPRQVWGRLDELPRAGIRLDAAPEPGWPRRISYPTRAALEAAAGQPLYPQVLLLDPAAADGYLRDWRPAGPAPERHLGYAVQWFALSLTLLILYIVVNLKPRESR
ncbi:MAG: SURF1 family protein [Pseudomonadota bacterium]|nr:SURF1 family protein [Pseudomonadota bacterium]